MHSNECSRIDNNNKVPVIVDLGTCPDTGARIYDLHPCRELLFDDNEILAELTGRNRSNNTPHPSWAHIVETTTSASRPNGVKGSTKLIRRCKCPCMKKMKASFCSCTICERARDALRRYRKLQVGWHHQSVEKRKQEFVTAKQEQDVSEEEIKKLMDDNLDQFEWQSCNGKCHAKAICRLHLL